MGMAKWTEQISDLWAIRGVDPDGTRSEAGHANLFWNSQGDLVAAHGETVAGWLSDDLWIHMSASQLPIANRLKGIPPTVEGGDGRDYVALFSAPDPRAAHFIAPPLSLLQVDARLVDAPSTRIGRVVENGRRVQIGQTFGRDRDGSFEFRRQQVDGGDEYVLLVPPIRERGLIAIHLPATLRPGTVPGKAAASIASRAGAEIIHGGSALAEVDGPARRRAARRARRAAPKE